jgi:hypothetical protein
MQLSRRKFGRQRSAMMKMKYRTDALNHMLHILNQLFASMTITRLQEFPGRQHLDIQELHC